MLNTKGINKKKTYDIEKEEELSILNSEKDDIFLIKNDNNNDNNNDNINDNGIENDIIESILILNDNIINNNIINKIESIEKLNINNIIFNENKNAFIINNDNNIFTILMSDIINYIINLSTNENSIKKHIFIISFNNITNNNEFNFINNTIFTNNINMMIKLQNLIYENINRDDFSKNDIIVKNKFLMFYYQLVIFMYKTTYDEKIYDKYKIINTYSTLAFRISSIILKQTFILQQKYESVSQELDDINIIKNNLHLKINKLSKQINIIQEISENIDNTENIKNNKNTDNNKNISNNENTDDTDITNITDNNDTDITNITDNNDSDIANITNNDDNIKKSINSNNNIIISDIKIKNSNNSKKHLNNIESLIDSLTSSFIELENSNKKITSNKNSENNNKISKNLLDSISFDSDNKYEEIDETSEPINEYINDLINISSMSTSAKNNSYNSKSVINNGKTYFNI